MYLSVVNRDPERAANIVLNGATRNGVGKIHHVTGPSPRSLNTEQDPELVTIEQRDWPEDSALLEIPAHSVAIVEFPIAQNSPDMRGAE